MTIAQQSTADRDVIDFTVMYSTHEAFRRDLARLAAAAESGGCAAPQIRAGWENFKRQLHTHHTVEDAELWPRVERAAADRPEALPLMREMEAEHSRLNPLLVSVDQAMALAETEAKTAAKTAAKTGAETGAGASTSSALVAQVRDLAEVLGDHMTHEEDSALPLIQEVLTPKDWSAFRSAMIRSQGPKGAAVYIPWILDGASAAEQERFLTAMPGPVRLINRLFVARRYRKRGLWSA